MSDHPSHTLLPRRRFLETALGCLALAALNPRAALANAAPPQNTISPEQALSRLLAGNARYAAGRLGAKDFSRGRAALAKAQYPIAAILSCADSRVAPELLFDQVPGDLFVIRVAGNYLDSDTLASLEYAVGVLKVPLVMVLGHTNCGAVKATVQEIQHPHALPGHLWNIVDAVRPGILKAVEAGGDHMLSKAVEANVDYNVARVASAQPVLAEAVQQRQTKVVGAVYQLETGKVLLRQHA